MKMKKLIFLLITLILLTSTASAGYTLTVGPHEKYKTIQGAVNAAHSYDTIKVASGTYKESVTCEKAVNFYGTKYPKVNGFQYKNGGGGTINGFSITPGGIFLSEAGGNTIRNNYFYGKGVGFGGQSCSGNTVMNNQFFKCGIYIDESYDHVITGNKINNAPVGLTLGEGVTCKTITKNTFKNCKVAVQLPYIPSCLTGNTYKGNKVNIKIVN